MDIAGLSVALSQNATLSQVGTAVLDNTLETNEVLGQNLVSMVDAAAMERSIYPHIGSNFDMIV